MSLKDRLKESRVKAKKTQAEVAEAVEMSQPAYQALESGRNSKSAFLPDIARFLNVDVHWLQTGVTSDAKVSNIIHHTASPIIVSKQEFGKDYIWLDVMNASFSCGDGVSIEYHFDEVRDSIPFPPEFFIRKQVKPENTKILIASGDSMEDYIYDQDLFAIDVTSTEILDGQIYAVYFEGEGMLKQIFKEEGGIVLHSLNPKYKDKKVTELNGNSFKVMGRQYWRAG